MTEIVFIGGAGRSGTTFLAHQLAGFQGIHTPGESPWIAALVEQKMSPHEYVPFAKNHWKVSRSPVHISDEDWARLDAIARKESARGFIKELMVLLARGGGIIIDHTPSNIAHRTALLSAFPEARFLHLVRDGRAVYASLKGVSWGPNTPPAAAQYWEASIARGLLAEVQLQEQVTRVYYEDIVKSRDALITLAAELLRTSTSSVVPKANSTVPLAGYTQKQHALVNHAPEPSRIGSWEKRLTRSEVLAFEYLTAGTLPYLGYQLTCQRISAPGHRQRLRWATEEYLRFAAINPLRNAARTRGAHLRRF